MKLKKSTTIIAGAVMALGMGSPAFADSVAEGTAIGSEDGGTGSGNVVQVPVSVPVNVCGNTVNVIALLNPAAGNTCVNK